MRRQAYRRRSLRDRIRLGISLGAARAIETLRFSVTPASSRTASANAAASTGGVGRTVAVKCRSSHGANSEIESESPVAAAHANQRSATTPRNSHP